MSNQRKTKLPSDPSRLLAEVRQHFLESKDFNGYSLKTNQSKSVIDSVRKLITDGLIESRTYDDFGLNPYIRILPSTRSIEDQIADLDNADGTGFISALYPTPLAMNSIALPETLARTPYLRDLALGRGQLELAFFEFDVLEQYRNNGRFDFEFGDAGVEISLKESIKEDDFFFARDKVHVNAGFAYNLSTLAHRKLEKPVERLVTAFYGDLAKLTPAHQRRWETHQVEQGGLVAHPLWHEPQLLGTWEHSNSAGPFTQLKSEMKNLNELCNRIYEEPLFRTPGIPTDMGWLLRSSLRDWEDFMLQLDKSLSDNMNSKFFDAAGIAKTGDDGKDLGTILRLQLFLKSGGVSEDDARIGLASLRKVRKNRQGPAHRNSENYLDGSFIWEQAKIMQEVILSLAAIRHFLSTHPDNESWIQPDKDVTYWII